MGISVYRYMSIWVMSISVYEYMVMSISVYEYMGYEYMSIWL